MTKRSKTSEHRELIKRAINWAMAGEHKKAGKFLEAAEVARKRK